MVTTKSVSRVVALEEAFLHPRVWDLYPEPLQRKYQPVRARLSEVGAERIRLMDAAGIDVQVLSHVQPGVQMLADAQAELAVAVSREVNDWLAEAVAAHPARFAGFAMLPTQSPAHAADELERTVREHGFKGALINGHTNGRYLDDPSFDVLLGRAESLGVPIYIHPTDPPQAVVDVYYAPFDSALVPTWGWPVETGTHLLRLICAGVFDRHPNLKVIVGHMGELLPFCFTRLNVGLTMAGWLDAPGSTSRNNVRLLLARKRLHHEQRRVRRAGVRLRPSDAGPRQPDVLRRLSVPGQLRRDRIPRTMRPFPRGQGTLRAPHRGKPSPA